VLASGTVDLAPPAAPTLTRTGEGDGTVSVSWTAVAGAASYDVWVSPVTGGGYVRANSAPVTGTTFTVEGLPNAVPAFVVVTANDAAGNRSGFSNEVEGLPHLEIGWANLQWPPSMTHTISTSDRTDTIYGQVWVSGGTDAPGPMPGLRAQVGFGPDGSAPSSASWTWLDAAFNTDAGNNDEFQGSLLPEAVGAYDYAYRYSTTNGRDWVYADLDGIPNGYSPAQAGALTVVASSDTTPPAIPSGLTVASASPAGIELSWSDDPDAALWEVQRTAAGGSGSFTRIGRTDGTTFTDTTVAEGATYAYRLVAIDGSFNRSAPSGSVSATAERRTVTVRFDVTVPASTDGVGRPVTIAGTLSRLDGGWTDWTPGVTELTRVDATHWSITLTGLESTQIAYKFVIRSNTGDAWAFVEKDGTAACGEIADRQLTLAYGTTGLQVVPQTVENWRNVAPCPPG
jgi:hypothetical protein